MKINEEVLKKYYNATSNQKLSSAREEDLLIDLTILECQDVQDLQVEELKEKLSKLLFEVSFSNESDVHRVYRFVRFIDKIFKEKK